MVCNILTVTKCEDEGIEPFNGPLTRSPLFIMKQSECVQEVGNERFQFPRGFPKKGKTRGRKSVHK